MAELEEPIDFVYLAQGDRVQPIVPGLSREDHKAARLKVKINSLITGVLEMHRCTTSETEGSKDFLERRVGVDVRRDAVARHVVVYCALVEVPEL